MEERTMSSEPYRLRSVSAYPDPLLVMKLPMEGVVRRGQVQLDNGTVLGFVHSPLPDQSRVEVYYDGWLFARQLSGPEQVPPEETGVAAGAVQEETAAAVPAVPAEDSTAAVGTTSQVRSDDGDNPDAAAAADQGEAVAPRPEVGEDLGVGDDIAPETEPATAAESEPAEAPEWHRFIGDEVRLSEEFAEEEREEDSFDSPFATRSGGGWTEAFGVPDAANTDEDT